MHRKLFEIPSEKILLRKQKFMEYWIYHRKIGNFGFTEKK
jgi:hypothetical protein